METICINCPRGCRLEVNKDEKGEIMVTGYGCIRGVQYGKEELVAPKRVVTSLIKGDNYLYSVKTTKPISKEKIFCMLEHIKNIKLTNDNYEIGDLIESELKDYQTDIVVTGKTSLNK